ncbi:MAG TPA: hypothetical protein VLX91_16125 [Candidatus Acidoferrales bacterium]|nr:hypothetical protein [Candidatus Acidoferrales bacterium]
MRSAVVITAYNRPEALSRPLRPISSGVYPDNVTLIISIDFGGTRRPEVLEIADAFEWKYGDKQIIRHKTHLGLQKQVFFAGSLASEYGSIIRLEDEYWISLMLYEYASNALEFYRDDPRIAAIALYNVWFNGIAREIFNPYLDAGDIYFMRSPWPHRQAFLSSQ